MRSIGLAALLALSSGCAAAAPAPPPHAPAATCIDEVSHRPAHRVDPTARCEADSVDDASGAGLAPVASPAEVKAERPGPSTAARDVALTAISVAAVGGTVYCAVECPSPWSTAVPVTVGSLLVVAFAVALATTDWGAVYATH